MDDSQAKLIERIAALEKAVADLQSQRPAPVADLPDNDEEARTVHGKKVIRRPVPAEKKKRRNPSLTLPTDPEVLLKWAGIGLVLLSVAFLFKYAVDEGWLTPIIRIALGIGIGVILSILGWMVYPKRGRFGQVFQGGGMAAFYISLFAGHQLLGVLDYEIAFGGMILVTLLGFGVGIYQKDPPLILIGLLGGLATPFVLYTGQSDVAGLMSYTCLLLAGTTAIYMAYGWRSVLYLTVVGGWMVFGIAQSALPWDVSVQVPDRTAIQLAVGFGVLAFWFAPVVRELLQAKRPPAVTQLPVTSKTASSLEWLFRNVVHQLIVVTPLLAVGLSALLWRLNETTGGLMFAGAAALYALVALALRSPTFEKLRYTHAVMAGLLATLSVVLLIDGDALLVALAAEAVMLHILSGRLNDKLIRSGAHSLSVILALWMWIRLVDNHPGTPSLVNASALSDLVVLALAVPAAFAVKNENHQRIYLALGYAGGLAWLLRELAPLPNGHAYVTVAWSLIGITLLIVGLRSHTERLRGIGLATLALVVGKLFMVDLAELDPLWRVAVFLGIGAGFLGVGYFLPNLWKPLLKGDGAPRDVDDDDEDQPPKID